MRGLEIAVFWAVCAGLPPAGLAQQTKLPLSAEYPSATVREEQKLNVDGVSETWQLRWASVPKRYCEASDFSSAITCPCSGFAYGEAGDLFLVRLREGTEIDRLQLTPFFAETFREAVLQRWPYYGKDLKDSERAGFSVRVSKRAAVQVMHFADYDHDGIENEFYLQTESAPCGKSVGIVIGLSTSNPRLHVFGTASHPRKPLYMQRREWEALHHALGPVEVVDWTCGDHGADTETRLRLHWSREGIDGVRREYTCPPDIRRLIHEERL